MIKREVVLMKPKHQYHLSQEGECVYGAQSGKKRRLLCEYVFVQIDRRTLIIKTGERKVFLMKPRHQFVYHSEENTFMVPSHGKKEDYYVNLCLSRLIDKF